jgi:UDP-N-acetylmuramyl pentapeptide phosphotransferase/UDP-N-acetylglucosamine-1-phosphate transferase
VWGALLIVSWRPAGLADVPLVIGLSVYTLGGADDYDAVLRQFKMLDAYAQAGAVAVASMFLAVYGRLILTFGYPEFAPSLQMVFLVFYLPGLWFGVEFVWRVEKQDLA